MSLSDFRAFTCPMLEVTPRLNPDWFWLKVSTLATFSHSPPLLFSLLPALLGISKCPTSMVKELQAVYLEKQMELSKKVGRREGWEGQGAHQKDYFCNTQLMNNVTL